MAVTKALSPSGALLRRIREISRDADPRSRKFDRLRGEIRKIAVRDNTDKLLTYASGMQGIDRYGRRLTKLGKWATGAALIRRGPGPVLVPHMTESRAITRFTAFWRFTGGQWRMLIGWRNLPWMRYHLEGGPYLARRDIGGTSPKGWVKVRAEFHRFVQNLGRGT